MKRGSLALLVALLLAGCLSDRPLSDPYAHSRSPTYRGELRELDVIGIDPAESVDERHIRNTLSGGTPVTLPAGSSILLVQSGAEMPDEEMLAALEGCFRVSPFTGRPPEVAGENYSRVLRLAAAKGGHATVVCYWGVVQASTENLATKGVSWVPIVGSVIPDETQRVRVRVKVLVLDTATGSWESFAATSDEDRALSASLNRASADVRQVDAMKAEAYRAAAEKLVRRF